MNIIILFALTFVSWTVFFYALQRKLELSARWSKSIHVALRDWNLEAAQDAKAAAHYELKWTFVLIGAMLVGLLFAVMTASAIKGVAS